MVACVFGTREVSVLTQQVERERVANVDVRTIAQSPGTTMMLPFVQARFELAVLAISMLPPIWFARLLEETVHVLSSGAEFYLLLWSPLVPSNSDEFAYPFSEPRT